MAHLYDLKIGPRVFQVFSARKVSTKEDLDGKVEYHPPKITVRADFGPFDRASTVLHEALHVMDDTHGLELGEAGVLTLEACLMELLVRNPEWALELLQGAAEGP